MGTFELRPERQVVNRGKGEVFREAGAARAKAQMQESHKVRGEVYDIMIDIDIDCKMITTVSLVNVHYHTRRYHFFFLT